MNPDHARDIKRSLSDPILVIDRLGLSKGSQRQASGALIRCPSHKDRGPSCSVTRGPDGTIRCKCFGCDWTADVLGLVAMVHGLDHRTQFPEVLAIAAELAGDWRLVEELRGTSVPEERRIAAPPPAAAEPPPPPRVYPPADEVKALWEGAGAVSDDPDASGCLVFRRIDPEAVDARRLARVLRPGQDLPRWARFQGQTWQQTGHRIILRVFDANGAARSVRSWRLSRDGDTPKRLPPSGHLATGLVLANEAAWKLLAGRAVPDEISIQEGEPDFLVAATRWDAAVLGIVSGSWTPEIAKKVSLVERVIIRTHNDAAGDKYAAAIFASLSGKSELWRTAS